MKIGEKNCNSKERYCCIKVIQGSRGEILGLKFISICSDCGRIIKQETLEGDFESPLDGRFHGACPLCGEDINSHPLYNVGKVDLLK